MSDDQQRAAERIPLEKPIDVTLNDVKGRIVELSLIGCKVEHLGRLNMGSTVNMDFLWQGKEVRLKAKVTRTEMRPIAGKPGYCSAMQLAATLEESPIPLRRMIAGLLGQPFEEPEETAAPEPEPVRERIPERPAARPAARPTPQTTGNRTPVKPKTSPPVVKPSSPPIGKQTRAVPPLAKPKPPMATPVPPPNVSQTTTLPPAKPEPPAPLAAPAPPRRSAPVVADDDEIEDIPASAEIRDDEEIEEIDELSVAEEIDEAPPDFVECILLGGKWIKRHVRDPRQPREGFTMLTPDDESEIDQYCRSYEVADPDTRRMIRVSFELTIARGKK